MSFVDFFKRKPTSSELAKDRLKFVLVSDRANCSPELMEQIKNDIIQVLTKYIEIDLEGLDIKLSQTEVDAENGAVPALFANIPIKDMKNSKDEAKIEARNLSKRNVNGSNVKRTIITPESKDKLKLTPNEIKVGNALHMLLNNWEDLFARMGSNKFNKSSILLFLQESTLLNTNEIRSAMKKYKSVYGKIREKVISEYL
jgi:cell division topological specificity factor